MSAEIEMLRNRAIVMEVDVQMARRELDYARRLSRMAVGGLPERVRDSEIELARAEGAAAGALYALRLAESEVVAVDV